jgi:thiol-disulfide isomerase/thioredoxin
MQSLRSVLMGLTLILTMALPAFSAESVPFEQARFAAAQKEGRPILIDISAAWCPICAAQKPIIERLSAKPEFKKLIIFRVDFDKQKEAVRGFDARMQSTLVGFHGTKETGRSVGDTKEPSIEHLLESTLR